MCGTRKIYVNSGGDALMLLERVVTHSPTIPFNRNSNSSNPEDSENGNYLCVKSVGGRGGWPEKGIRKLLEVMF